MRLLAIFLLLSASAFGQLWSGIINTPRATDWTGAGVTGGITLRSTICATFNPGATASQINAQLQSASCQNKVVKLNAGTYNIAALDFGGNSSVTLRGAGSNQTFITFTGDTGCQGFWSFICIGASDLGFYTDHTQPPAHAANWTAGYSVGTTVITLSSTTGLVAGMYIALDGCDTGFSGNPCTGSAVINSTGIENCSTAGVCSSEGVTTNGRDNRGQRELIQVTNVNSGTGQVTLARGIRYPNWGTINNPGAYWGNNGTSYSCCNSVEDISISANQTGDSANSANIMFAFDHDSWVKNVRSLYAPNGSPGSSTTGVAHINMYVSAHITIQDSYFYGSWQEQSEPQHYGVLAFGADDILVQNNIFQRRTVPFVADAGTGNVFAYNYAVFDRVCKASGSGGTIFCPTESPFMQVSYYLHSIGNGYLLWEGNIGPGFKADVVHGSSNLTTVFRNRLIGWEPNKTAETYANVLYPFHRFYNLIGNVEGRSGYHTTYSRSSTAGNCTGETTVYKFGCAQNSAPQNDDYTPTSVMLWGNYTVVKQSTDTPTNSGVRFVSSEVPTGLGDYPNTVPASQTLPSSFYLSAKPSWWGVSGQPAIPWPGIGPDISSGTIYTTGGTSTWTTDSVDGHANMNPAMVMYKNVMGGSADGSGGPYAFDGSLYQGTSAVPPSASLTAPLNGANVSGLTTVSASCTAGDFPIANVQFTLDSANLGAADTTAPYSISWDTTAATQSSHTLSCVCTDTSSNTGLCPNVTVTVNNNTNMAPAGFVFALNQKEQATVGQ